MSLIASIHYPMLERKGYKHPALMNISASSLELFTCLSYSKC